MIALGVVIVLIEYLLTVSFHITFVGWSVYPLIVFALLGGLLIFWAINSSAREKWKENFLFSSQFAFVRNLLFQILVMKYEKHSSHCNRRKLRNRSVHSLRFARYRMHSVRT